MNDLHKLIGLELPTAEKFANNCIKVYKKINNFETYIAETIEGVRQRRQTKDGIIFRLILQNAILLQRLTKQEQSLSE